MPLSEFEISRIAEIVAGRVGANLDAKSLRQVVDRVVDALTKEPGNANVAGVTCDLPRGGSSPVTQTVYPSTPYQPSQAGSGLSGAPSPLPRSMAGEDPHPERAGLYQQIEATNRARIIIAAFGKNRPGIVAAITNVIAEVGCSIEDISQTIMQEFFSMIMIVDISGCKMDFSSLRDRIQGTETQYGMKVYVMHEDIFRYMHRI